MMIMTAARFYFSKIPSSKSGRCETDNTGQSDSGGGGGGRGWDISSGLGQADIIRSKRKKKLFFFYCPRVLTSSSLRSLKGFFPPFAEISAQSSFCSISVRSRSTWGACLSNVRTRFSASFWLYRDNHEIDKWRRCPGRRPRNGLCHPRSFLISCTGMWTTIIMERRRKGTKNRRTSCQIFKPIRIGPSFSIWISLRIIARPRLDSSRDHKWGRISFFRGGSIIVSKDLFVWLVKQYISD